MREYKFIFFKQGCRHFHEFQTTQKIHLSPTDPKGASRSRVKSNKKMDQKNKTATKKPADNVRPITNKIKSRVAIHQSNGHRGRTTTEASRLPKQKLVAPGVDISPKLSLDIRKALTNKRNVKAGDRLVPAIRTPLRGQHEAPVNLINTSERDYASPPLSSRRRRQPCWWIPTTPGGTIKRAPIPRS